MNIRDVEERLTEIGQRRRDLAESDREREFLQFCHRFRINVSPMQLAFWKYLRRCRRAGERLG